MSQQDLFFSEHLNSNAIMLQHSALESSILTISLGVFTVQILIGTVVFCHNCELFLAFHYSLPEHTPGVTIYFLSPRIYPLREGTI